MAIGYLSIQARTAHDAIPLGGVQIRVLDDKGNTVYVMTTDESGETQKVPLETLSRDFSRSQYFSEMPYVSYGVLAQKAGFNTMHIADIPIFEGETAVLPVMLVPMRESRKSPARTDIIVGRPAVAMTVERNQEGRQDAPYVLRQVVIPDPITVHLGAPSAAASNVQVPFIDYVKNVASSEIYPTWPEAALRANIYAIITFALNRVYTEWYRSRGYNFDITSSPAYDQYFVYGRPIYSSVAKIADQIFNEYVRRPGQTAPYFTSFCNGTTVTCGGLSQWGTVTLAERGLTPLQILRAYYPNDIEIVHTNAITGVISSYPGTALRMGSKGLDVQTIQTYLNRIRKNYPAIPQITDKPGEFGESTKAAVTSFQSVFNLVPDGVVGKATWYKISSLYSAVARLSELDSEGNTLGIGTVPPSATLRMGSRSQDVVTLQYLLDVISEFYPGIPSVTQDGIFGAKTKEAVAAFQQQTGLAADGVVGRRTWAALYETYKGIGDSVPPSDPGEYIINYVVRPGDSLWELARKYGTTVEEIKRLNGLTGNTIYVGQTLRIPVGAGGYSNERCKARYACGDDGCPAQE